MLGRVREQIDVNIEKEVIIASACVDEGGGDQGPCFLTMPRGCVVCVAGRTQSCHITVSGGGGFVVKAGR